MENENQVPEDNVVNLSDKRAEKKSRQQRRAEQRTKVKQQVQIRKELNTIVTRKDLAQFYLYVQRISERMYHLDILSAAMERVLVQKGITNREEINAALEFEKKRSEAFKQVNEDPSFEYKKNLDKCKEFDINPDTTMIPIKMLTDKHGLSEAEIMAIATDYNIQIILDPEKREQILNPKLMPEEPVDA